MWMMMVMISGEGEMGRAWHGMACNSTGKEGGIGDVGEASKDEESKGVWRLMLEEMMMAMIGNKQVPKY